MRFAFLGAGRALVDVSSVPSGNGMGNGGGGLPTAAVVALPLGAFAVLALMASIIYYFKSERRIRKEANMAPHQRHHHQSEIKDLSLTTPCLPRGVGGVEPPQSQPPQPPDSSSMHHRFQPPNCIPYSVKRLSVNI